MRKIDFLQIGNYSSDPEGKLIRITIKPDLKDALIKLNHFSHCLVFTKEDCSFHCYTARIVNISEKTGEVLIESDIGLEGELVDIKPYFPCEEKADGYVKETELGDKYLESLSFRGEPIGKFINSHDGGVIQFQESENLTAEAITEAVKNIKEGTFLRLIWWFDRFDDKRYRSHLMCNPPYENAPRCGVFATRSPVRPNPLASTIVKVKSADPYNRRIAFDTIYRESQKQFFDLNASNALTGAELNDSKVKKITGLQPSIAIEQKSPGLNPRSTVASVTRIGEYLRLLFATVGERVCPNCNEPVPENNVCNVCGTIFFSLTPASFNYNNPEYMCPACKGLGEELQVDVDLIVTNPEMSILDGASPWWGNLRKHRENPNANWMKGEVLALAFDMNEDLEVPFKDLSEEFKNQIFFGSNGRLVTLNYENSNGRSGTITRPVEGAVNILKRLLAENRASGSTEGIDRFIVSKKCSRCNGERLLEEGRLVRIGTTRYPEATIMSISTLRNWCHFIYGNLDETNREKCRDILKRIITRLKKLEQVGLGYINPDRSIPSLSGGEVQRLKIANQFGSGLSNILYIMDEPSKGLHPKDFQFLIEAIQDLKKMKNTVIVVEHKKELIQMADYLIEIGPGAGKYGGQLLSAGPVKQCMPYETNEYEYNLKDVIIEDNAKIVLKGARTNNLKNIDVSIPFNKLTCVIGVSGSGKSSLISKTLYPAIAKKIGRKVDTVGDYDCISGAEYISEIYYVSQKPIGRNSRSTPGTYTGVFELIRDYYAKLDEAKAAKMTKERFSFNSPKGQCEACKGTGEIAIPMYFMEDLYVSCDKCKGQRYKESVLKIKYKGYSISDLLDMEIGEVKEIFKNDPGIYEALDMLCKVGLSYLKLGQNATTLSGGEAQRIRLAKEICYGKTEGAVYILDEPASGLHDDDVDKLNNIIRELISKGATIVVTEHNPKIIRQADYIIELGPEGGENGGFLLKEGFHSI